MNEPVILIPAAGASSRMGGCDKLMQEVDGTPLLLRQVHVATFAGHKVLVTLPQETGARHELIKDQGVEAIPLADAGEGMAASMRFGAAWAKELKAPALMILLADMPEIEAEDLALMIAAWRLNPNGIFRGADCNGQAGHPVIFPARCFTSFETLTGDRGAGALLKNEDVRLIPLPDHRATTDLDTPEEWANWRVRTGR